MTTATGGRPRHEPTAQSRAMAETFSAFGIPQDDIARLIGITGPTLREHYREELDLGLLKANAKVAQNLFTIACKPTREGLDAAKFWLRVRAGWSEYSPPPDLRRRIDDVDEKLGKKETANREAQTAEKGTSWAALLKH
jgi:hypothetical protein